MIHYQWQHRTLCGREYPNMAITSIRENVDCERCKVLMRTCDHGILAAMNIRACPVCGEQTFCGLTVKQVLEMKKEVEGYRSGRRAELLAIWTTLQKDFPKCMALDRAKEVQRALDEA